MNIKKIVIYLIALVVAGVIIVLLVKFFWGSSEKTSDITEADSSTGVLVKPVNAPSGDTLSLGTKSGIIVVNNFYVGAAGVDEEFLVIRRNKDYEITYNTHSSSFFIYITGQPLNDVRAVAEEDFARTLEISKEDICKLDVAEGVSSRVDKTLASRNFGLSFCIPSL